MNIPHNIPSHDAISIRARDIWESSGQIDGQDLANWLQAEKELLDETPAEAGNEGPLKNLGSVESNLGTPDTASPLNRASRGGESLPGKQGRLRR
jgi:hypothetical protein